MDSEGMVRFLVKATGSVSTTPLNLGLSGDPIKFAAKPLFKSIGLLEEPAVAAQPTWQIVETAIPSAGVSQWELCHAMIAYGENLAAGGVEFVEPDLEQQWSIGLNARADTSFAVREGGPHKQDPEFPHDPDDYWFRNQLHGQFDVVEALSDPGPGKRVRIAHLDTGFDPKHKSRPAFLSTSEQRNFVDEACPNDATDRSSGLFNNFSHGTGTLSILAGAAVSGQRGFGCAPNAEIIPLRVANRVVIFRNSAIAQALDYVHLLCRNRETFVHVVTMSMGGLPSQAWADAVNALYEVGVFVVTAAGNNYANIPSHFVVYPARFNRVVAACGSMANGQAYADLKSLQMAGDYGPPEKMATAISAYTPNVPWARFGEPDVVDFDGAGTSAATPQVAGAAALWIQKNRAAYDAYPEPWMRVEAVRAALFATAGTDSADTLHFGAGRLKAKDAIASVPAPTLKKQPTDDATGSLLNVLIRPDGSVAGSPMLDLELRQVLQATGLEMQIGHTGRAPHVSSDVIRQVSAMPTISPQLRRALSAPPPAEAKQPLNVSSDRLNIELAKCPKIPIPHTRKLRVYAYDPSPQTDPLLFGINEAIVSVPWEVDLTQGPTGEYLEVVDIDPASRCCYTPVDLNHPYLLATDGHAPSEANPQFHQQMAYAVAMRTINRFERALGRKALWAPRIVRDAHGNVVDEIFVQRLRIYPHAMREQNSYYSSQRMALLFGYFAANEQYAGNALPGSQIFCSVSHDIVAHETTHALLDGLHPRFQEGTNPDVLAFHEAFADIIALFLHFTMPESLLQQIRRTRGDLTQESLLGQLAVQFGEASGMHGALRSAIGHEDEDHKWQPAKVTRTDYETRRSDGEPHALGSILVSAVFAAFVTIYLGRSADLIRLATDGTGILRAGEISHDLAIRLAQEAATVADQVLNICIRALDYVPPVDITFGEYLRALITADRDLVPDDERGYRVAFIAAFRDRGIFPKHVRHLAEDSLVWLEQPIDLQPSIDRGLGSAFPKLVDKLSLDWNLNSDRKKAYDTSRINRRKVRDWMVDPDHKPFLDAMGFDTAAKDVTIGTMTGELRPIEVHSVRPTRRTAPDGTSHAWLIIEITQTFRTDVGGEHYRGGCTVVIDLNTNRPKYFIRKRLKGPYGAEAQKAARAVAEMKAAERGVPYFPPGDPLANHETFALLHRS